MKQTPGFFFLLDPLENRNTFVMSQMIEYVSNRKKMRPMQRKKNLRNGQSQMTDKQIWIHESTKVWTALGGFSYLNNKYTTASLNSTCPSLFCWISAICNRKFYWIELTDFEFIPSASTISLFVFWDDLHSNTHPTSQTLLLASLPEDSRQSGSPWCCWGWPPWPPSGAPEWCPGAEGERSGFRLFHRAAWSYQRSPNHPIMARGRNVLLD